MKSSEKRKIPSSALQEQLSELEERAGQRKVHIHYDLLEAAGLKLKGGICKIKGEYHIFVDRRKSTAEKVDFLQGYLNNPLPEDIPSD